MKLTVAMKIIGGFTIISLLLFVTSAISWNSLTLKGSNKLANDLTGIGNLTLRAYYQTALAPLAQNQTAFDASKSDFRAQLKKLKSLVQDEASLIANLRKVDPVYESLESEIDSVINSRKFAIEQHLELIEKIDFIDTKLQRAVSLAERLETLLNSMVSSSFEYREISDQQSAELVTSEIENSFNDIEKSINDVVSELNTQGVADIADELMDSFKALQNYITSMRLLQQPRV